ncbi:interactor of constitutive active ROPs 4-like [Tasmannia lanceolata]|uniref:interactor of constitutive active ROPs 4-like n=1 Tax=Tasmannia lanceolata TaxID=3420 RepID=UPI004063A6F4
MPRSRGSEMPQRQSPRVPLQLRTSSSESDGHHSTNRPIIDRSSKLSDRRSPRGPLTEKKRGPRIADLESQLSQTQEELKKLKEQVASAEAAKREAQEELEMTKKQIPEEKIPQQKDETNDSQTKSHQTETFINENSPETDVFEVPAVIMPVEPKVEKDAEPIDEFKEALAEPEPEPENVEVVELKAKLERFSSENDELKRKVLEVEAEVSMARAREEEAGLKLSRMGEELDEAVARAARVKLELEAAEGAKLVLETEMGRMKVQTEQWRKAADAAAAVLSGGVEMNGGVRERCGSMMGFESDGYSGFGSPMADGFDDGLGGGKRKGGGMRVFGDLWKKKGQK